MGNKHAKEKCSNWNRNKNNNRKKYKQRKVEFEKCINKTNQDRRRPSPVEPETIVLFQKDDVLDTGTSLATQTSRQQIDCFTSRDFNDGFCIEAILPIDWNATSISACKDHVNYHGDGINAVNPKACHLSSLPWASDNSKQFPDNSGSNTYGDSSFEPIPPIASYCSSKTSSSISCHAEKMTNTYAADHFVNSASSSSAEPDAVHCLRCLEELERKIESTMTKGLYGCTECRLLSGIVVHDNVSTATPCPTINHALNDLNQTKNSTRPHSTTDADAVAHVTSIITELILPMSNLKFFNEKVKHFYATTVTESTVFKANQEKKQQSIVICNVGSQSVCVKLKDTCAPNEMKNHWSRVVNLFEENSDAYGCIQSSSCSLLEEYIKDAVFGSVSPQLKKHIGVQISHVSQTNGRVKVHSSKGDISNFQEKDVMQSNASHCCLNSLTSSLPQQSHCLVQSRVFVEENYLKSSTNEKRSHHRSVLPELQVVDGNETTLNEKLQSQYFGKENGVISTDISGGLTFHFPGVYHHHGNCCEINEEERIFFSVIGQPQTYHSRCQFVRIATHKNKRFWKQDLAM